MSAITALVLVQARRDRMVLPAWILGIAFLGYAVAGAVATEFHDKAERAAIITVAAASPACSSADCPTGQASARWCSSRVTPSPQFSQD